MRVLDWERDVWADPRVTRAHAAIERLFETNEAFRDSTLDLVQTVLGSKTARAEIGAEALREGANYVLKELAFMGTCRSLLGVDVIIPYHRRFVLGASFTEGVYGEAAPGVGWLVYDVELFTESTHTTGEHHGA
jgi:tRNA-dependent cyclodipeptide synthase